MGITLIERIRNRWITTVDNNEPWIRLMALIPYKNKYYVTTKAARHKVKEIQMNNNFEF